MATGSDPGGSSVPGGTFGRGGASGPGSTSLPGRDADLGSAPDPDSAPDPGDPGSVRARATAIDTHAHVYPAWYLDRLEEIGVDPQSTRIARGLGADSTGQDLAERFRWMDRARVGLQVLAVTPQVPSGPDPASSLAAAREVNDHYADLVRGRPDRFLAYGTLPLPHIRESLAEIPRIFGELGMAGVSVTTLAGGLSLASSELDPVWEALDEHGAVVNIHPTGCGARSPMITEHRLEWVNGAPVEDATATLHLLKADVPRRFPRLRFHIAHLGGDLPFLAQRIEDNYEDWNAFPASPNEVLRTMWFDAANFHTPSLQLAAATLGASQILAGSDHPYFQREKYVRAFHYVRRAPLSEADIDAVLTGNAAALYGLEGNGRAGGR
ncbi:amidohydrolase [Nocardiopsis sp. HNM0947]|uniref:Amidohydrolase n=1 Tax=Nocardiopsis coralli TaxID=2772213 RepID=A0ABR9PDJ6_9ACTN|nr:amidohydrolase family protein [Nocardiopsis coralli]MBE3001931.1 amidohydrolase [Nocardiopsis coralli]